MRPTASLWHKLPRRSVTTVVQNDTQNLYMDHEYCFLVDTEDRPVGTASKKVSHKLSILFDYLLSQVCHERKYSQRPPLHRAFSLFLYAPKKDADCGSVNLCLLMQQRAPSKLTYPKLWSNTCCSHPLSTIPGEDEQKDALGLRRASQRKVSSFLYCSLGVCYARIPELHAAWSLHRSPIRE